jgi:hypothetical protein
MDFALSTLQSAYCSQQLIKNLLLLPFLLFFQGLELSSVHFAALSFELSGGEWTFLRLAATAAASGVRADRVSDRSKDTRNF